MGAVKRARTSPPVPEAGTFAAPLAGTFGASLLSPTVQVRVQGITFHIHEEVLSKIPFFERMRKGGWADSVSPDVDLPCSAKEFALLLSAIYTGRPLGSLAFPVEDFSVATRLAQAADMLLILDLFPELQGLLRMLPRSEEQTAAAHAALPKALSEALRVSSAVVPANTVSEMLQQAGQWENVREGALAVLACCSTEEHKKAIAQAVGKMLASRSDREIQFAASLAKRFLDCALASTAFEEAPSQCETKIYCRTKIEPWAAALLQEFRAHLERCAVEGVDCTRLLAKCRRDMSKPYGPPHGTQPLAFDHSCRDTIECMAGLVDSKSLAEQLAAFPPGQLASLVTMKILKALGSHAQPVCVALLPRLGHLSKELVDPIVRGVTGA